MAAGRDGQTHKFSILQKKHVSSIDSPSVWPPAGRSWDLSLPGSRRRMAGAASRAISPRLIPGSTHSFKTGLYLKRAFDHDFQGQTSCKGDGSEETRKATRWRRVKRGYCTLGLPSLSLPSGQPRRFNSGETSPLQDWDFTAGFRMMTGIHRD